MLIRLLTAAAFAFLVTACATLVGLPTEGQVLEGGTNQPIADAIVIVRWVGVIPTPGHSQSACVHVESTTTDKDGRYRTNAWRAPSTAGPAPLMRTRIGPGASAYKPGYEYVDTRGEAVYLRGTREARFESLWRVFSTTGCQAAGRSSKNLYPLYKAALEESTPLAVSEEERRRLQIMRELTASAWIAQDISRSTSEERKLVKELVRDGLP